MSAKFHEVIYGMLLDVLIASIVSHTNEINISILRTSARLLSHFYTPTPTLRKREREMERKVKKHRSAKAKTFKFEVTEPLGQSTKNNWYSIIESDDANIYDKYIHVFEYEYKYIYMHIPYTITKTATAKSTKHIIIIIIYTYFAHWQLPLLW